MAKLVALAGQFSLLPLRLAQWYVQRDQDVLTRLLSSPAPGATPEAEAMMPTLMIFHEVNDVEHWLGSPKREEVFGPLGVTVRTFIDPAKTNRVGLIAQVPDMETFQRIMESDEAAEAMKYDGVRPETLLVLVEP